MPQPFSMAQLDKLEHGAKERLSLHQHGRSAKCSECRGFEVVLRLIATAREAERARLALVLKTYHPRA